MQTLLTTVGYYLAAGLLFGLFFVFRGASLKDTDMKGSSFMMKLFLLPGSALLWPVMFYNILTKRTEKLPGSKFRLRQLIMWIVVTLLLIVGIILTATLTPELKKIY